MWESHILYFTKKWSIIGYVYIGLDLLTNMSIYKPKKENSDPFNIHKTKYLSRWKVYTE